MEALCGRILEYSFNLHAYLLIFVLATQFNSLSDYSHTFGNSKIIINGSSLFFWLQLK